MIDQPRHRSQSILSHRTNSTWREDVFGKPRLNRGAMVFTGPDSLRMHRQKVLDPEYVGEGNWGWTPERTSSTSYLLKGAPNAPHPRPKSGYSDAIGWGAWGVTADLGSWRHLGHQIKLGTFRQQLEHNATHRFQEPWYEAPAGRDTSANRMSSGQKSGRLLGQREQQSKSSTSRSGSLQSLSAA